jgi:phosphate transport system substrate-binding protein
MNAEVICGIYSGEIKRWNDSKITDLNPTVKALRTMTNLIVPVARDAGSGTTSIFSTYLATGASTAQNKCGYTSDWANTVTSFSSLSGTILPAEAVMNTRFSAMRTANSATQAIEVATGNDGIQAKVQSTSYSLGYVEVSYTSGSNIRQVALATKSLNTSGANSGKPNYLTASAAGATAALARHLADATGTGESPINPGYAQFLQPVNQLGLTSYPIVGYSWVLVYKNYVSTVTNAPTKGQVEGLIYFLNWSLVKGKAATIGSTTTKAYAPLPATVKAAVIAQLKLVKYDGVTVWR